MPDKAKVEALPDKVVKPETTDTDSKTPKKTTKGEYSEAKKSSMTAMKGYYGDKVEITDDNYHTKMEGMVAADYGPTKEKIGKYDAANKRLMAMMEEHPEFAGIAADLNAGAKLPQILNKYFDLKSIIDSKGGDEGMYEENNKTRMANYDKNQAYRKKLDDNEAKSLKVIKAFHKEMKLEGEGADKFAKWVAEMIDLANSGDITKEFLTKMYYAMNYQSDVATAEEKGKISAKNTKIEEKMKSEEEIKSSGDGTPNLESSNDKVESEDSKSDFASRLEKTLKKKTKDRLF